MSTNHTFGPWAGPMRRMRDDFTPVKAVIGLIDDMPLPEPAELRRIVSALRLKLYAANPKRFDAVLDALSDVNLTLADCEPESRDCEGCAGSGDNRHNGAVCIACHGQGVTA